MTKKDYVLIADAVAEVMRNATEAETETLEKVLSSLTRALGAENPRFNPVIFRARAWCEGWMK